MYDLGLTINFHFEIDSVNDVACGIWVFKNLFEQYHIDANVKPTNPSVGYPSGVLDDVAVLVTSLPQEVKDLVQYNYGDIHNFICLSPLAWKDSITRLVGSYEVFVTDNLGNEILCSHNPSRQFVLIPIENSILSTDGVDTIIVDVYDIP